MPGLRCVASLCVRRSFARLRGSCAATAGGPALGAAWLALAGLVAGVFGGDYLPRGRAAEPAASATEGEELRRDVYVSGQEGYHTFRIPALLSTPAGTLLAFCEGRKTSREDLGDNDMFVKRSTDGGRTWGPLQLIYDEGTKTIGNPTAVYDHDTGVIWLFMVRDIHDVLVSHSKDDGRTWSPPADVTSSAKRPEWKMYAVGPGVGIQIRHGRHRGRLVIPAYHRETAHKGGPSAAHVVYSDDHGQTWRVGGTAGLHTNECQLAETPDGEESVLVLNMRNHWARSGGMPEKSGRRLVSRSRDGGATWTEPAIDEALIEPTCQASLIRYLTEVKPTADSDPAAARDVLLFANPAARGRTNLTVRLSEDGGKTWPRSWVADRGASAYSSLAQLSDGRVGLLYESENYGKITFVAFPLGRLTAAGKE